jgi:hypothetical protein
MLEKMPRVLGEALSGLKAGLDGTTYLSEFPAVPEGVRVGSDAFADRAPLPPRFTADGEGVLPPLSWDGLPQGTVSVAVIVEDAGSPTPRPLVHLLAWNLDPAASLAICSLIVGGGLAAYSLAERDFRRRDHLLGGIGIGLTVVAAWWASAHACR